MGDYCAGRKEKKRDSQCNRLKSAKKKRMNYARRRRQSATRTRRSAKGIGLSSNSAPRTTRVSRAIANGWSPFQPVENSVPTVFARPRHPPRPHRRPPHCRLPRRRRHHRRRRRHHRPPAPSKTALAPAPASLAPVILDLDLAMTVRGRASSAPARVSLPQARPRRPRRPRPRRRLPRRRCPSCRHPRHPRCRHPRPSRRCHLDI